MEKIRDAAVMKVANTIGPKFLAKKDKDLMARLRGILRKFSVGRFTGLATEFIAPVLHHLLTANMLDDFP